MGAAMNVTTALQTRSSTIYVAPMETKQINFTYNWERGESYIFRFVTERGRTFAVSATASS